MAEKEWEDLPGKGTLFVSQKKSDKSPDYKGKILIDTKLLSIRQDGTAYMSISAWTKPTKTGSHLLSLSQDAPYGRPANGGGFTTQSPNVVGLMNNRKDREVKIEDGEIPF